MVLNMPLEKNIMVLEKHFIQDVELTGGKLAEICKKFRGKIRSVAWFEYGQRVEGSERILGDGWHLENLLGGHIYIKRPLMAEENIIIDKAESNIPNSPEGYVVTINARNERRVQKYKKGIDKILKE